MLSKDLLEFPRSEYIGRAKRIDDAQARYIEYAKRSFPKDKTLENIKIVLDWANGASYKVAPETFWELGAQVTVIGNQPNGKNINNPKPEEIKDNLWFHLDYEEIVHRIIKASSFKLNWVLDPFMNVGAVGVVAKKRGRRFIGFESSQDQILLAMKTINERET